MKLRVISLATLLLAVGSAVAANPPASPPDGGQDRMDRLAILLDLNASQKVEVQKVLDEQFQQARTQRQQAKESGTRPTREQMRAQHDQMHKETVEKLRGILSDQQMTKFEALTEHQEGRMHRWHGDRDQQSQQPSQESQPKQ